MTQEDKQLLLVDLSARLPYGVKCKDDYIEYEGKLSQIGINYNMCLLSDVYGKTEWVYIPNCKPYLFPMSSMTEEQIEELGIERDKDSLLLAQGLRRIGCASAMAVLIFICIMIFCMIEGI